jgi:hypothetical protein
MDVGEQSNIAEDIRCLPLKRNRQVGDHPSPMNLAARSTAAAG